MSSSRPLYIPRPPPGLRRKLWEWTTKFEVTFALSMMQPWEKAVIWCIFAIAGFLLYLSLLYLPGDLSYLLRRYAYYIYGDEDVAIWGSIKDWIAAELWKGVEVGKSMMGAAGGRIMEL
ncbi:uncharacterized protein L203_104957 [Cryptococcus depauperatus CBS 7841]|uniref:Uncharacterized protein n=1 Tax=Cryptococcus depauperatus CBS 7841 TaxID=1295531 RepID=A0A1E3IMT8_9TREE|nr:hypothetical protein L203_01829 [Cryptococcus depauperatus CBS 7841]